MNIVSYSSTCSFSQLVQFRFAVDSRLWLCVIYGADQFQFFEIYVLAFTFLCTLITSQVFFTDDEYRAVTSFVYTRVFHSKLASAPRKLTSSKYWCSTKLNHSQSLLNLFSFTGRWSYMTWPLNASIYTYTCIGYNCQQLHTVQYLFLSLTIIIQHGRW